MEHNIGRNGRIWRVVAGVALLVFGLLFAYPAGFGLLVTAEAAYGVLGWLLAVIGVVLVLEGAVSFDIVNALIKRNTCLVCRQGVTRRHTPE